VIVADAFFLERRRTRSSTISRVDHDSTRTCLKSTTACLRANGPVGEVRNLAVDGTSRHFTGLLNLKGRARGTGANRRCDNNTGAGTSTGLTALTRTVRNGPFRNLAINWERRLGRRTVNSDIGLQFTAGVAGAMDVQITAAIAEHCELAVGQSNGTSDGRRELATNVDDDISSIVDVAVSGSRTEIVDDLPLQEVAGKGERNMSGSTATSNRLQAIIHTDRVGSNGFRSWLRRSRRGRRRGWGWGATASGTEEVKRLRDDLRTLGRDLSGSALVGKNTYSVTNLWNTAHRTVSNTCVTVHSNLDNERVVVLEVKLVGNLRIHDSTNPYISSADVMEVKAVSAGAPATSVGVRQKFGHGGGRLDTILPIVGDILYS
jgi:hypothetical protein